MPALSQLLRLSCVESAINFSPLQVAPETLLSDAIAIMAQQSEDLANPILVIEDSQLVGCLTEQDVVRLVATGVDFQTTNISVVMNTSVITYQRSELEDRAALMALFQQHQLRLLPVVDEQGQIVGVITPESIFQVLTTEEDSRLPENPELESCVQERTEAFQAMNRQLLNEIADSLLIEEQLRQSQQMFQLIMDYIPQSIFWKDRNSVYLGCNRKFAQDANIGIPENIIGKTDYDLPWTREEMEWYRHCDRRVMESNTPELHIMETQQQADNKQIYIDTNKVPLHDNDGNVVGILGTYEDITIRQQSQEALANSEERFRNLVETSSDLVWEMDENCFYTYVSPKISDILGYEAQEVLGKTPLQTVPPELREQAAEMFIQTFNAQQPFQWTDSINLHKNGHLVILETNGVPVFDNQGKLRGYRGISRDVTERKQAEAKLHQTQAHLQAILDNSPAVIYVLDSQDKYLVINREYEKLLNKTTEEIAGKSIYEIWPHEIAEKFVVTLNKVMAEGISLEVEEVVPQSDGVHTYFSVQFPLKDANGTPYAVCGISTDITERKRAEDSLLRFQKAIESTSDAIAIGEMTGKTTYINPAFTELFEYSLEEVQALGGCVGLFQEQQQFPEIRETLQNGGSWRGEVKMKTRSGRLLDIEFRTNVIKDANSKMIGLIGISTDITERKRAETALLLSQQRLQYLLLSSPAVIYSCKPDDNFSITFVSDSVTTMMGYQAREFMQDSSFWVKHIHPEDVSLVFANANKQLQQGKYQNEYRFLHQDGTYRWVYDKGKVVQDDTGNPLEIVGYWADITDRKRLEQELRLALNKEKQLNKLKSSFVSMTSHEFRTPLSTILSSAELLEYYRHKWTEEKQLTHLNRIQTSVQHMTEMLNDVLVIGKAEMGKLDVNPAPLDLVQYCYSVVEELELNIKTYHGIIFCCEYESIQCCMDEKLLRHILINLLSNAIKYSLSNSTIRFTLRCEEGEAILEIQDHGIGIPSEDLSCLFESFYRAHNVGNIPGTGLGLAIVKKCVDIQKGKITVKSDIGLGTTFIVTLPLGIEIFH